MENEEKKIDENKPVEKTEELVETLSGNGEPEVKPVEKGTVIFFLVFLIGLMLFVLFLPSVSGFLSNIKDFDWFAGINSKEETNDEKETENTKEEVTELSDIDLENVIAEVSGDVVCAISENSGLYAYEVAEGYTFVDDKLTAVNYYSNRRYSEEVTYTTALTTLAIEIREQMLNAVDGVEGSTIVGEYFISDRYLFDLSKYDYLTPITIDDNLDFSLDYTSIEKEALVTEKETQGMTCSEVTE